MTFCPPVCGILLPTKAIHHKTEGALNLIQEGKKDKAAKALAYAEKVIPAYNVPMNYLSGGIDIAKADRKSVV